MDRIWLWVYYNKIPIYPIVHLLKGDSKLTLGFRVSPVRAVQDSRSQNSVKPQSALKLEIFVVAGLILGLEGGSKQHSFVHSFWAAGLILGLEGAGFRAVSQLVGVKEFRVGI